MVKAAPQRDVLQFESATCAIFLNRLVSRAHDVWNGAAAGNTTDMGGVDIPRLPVFTWWIDGRTEAWSFIRGSYRRFESYPIHLLFMTNAESDVDVAR